MTPKFLRDLLIKHLEITDLDFLERENLLSSFEELAQKAILNSILENLSIPDRQNFITLISADQTGFKAMKFAYQKIPMLNEKLAQTIKKEVDLIKNK